MINIPIKTEQDAMKLFNLFEKKEKRGLEAAEQQGLITHEEFLRIAADRAAADLDKFLGKEKIKPRKKTG